MNIIAFVIGILMIFAITTTSLLKKHTKDHIVSKSFSGYMKASRKALNEAEASYFSEIKALPPQNKNNPKRKKSNENENEKIVKTRDINPENAKINIFKIFLDKKENQKDLYNTTAKLIKILYSNKSFYYEKLEKILLDNILHAIENQLNDQKDLHLSNLVFKEQSFQRRYYKILKGTKFYDFEKNIGTPSLIDFIKFEDSNKKIPIKDASEELLIATFNKKIAKELQVLQKENPPKNLNFANVLNLCKKHSFFINEKFLDDFFDFSDSLIKSKNKIIVGIDKSTNIKVKRKISI